MQSRQFAFYAQTAPVYIRGDLRPDYGAVGNNALISALQVPIALIELDGIYGGGGSEFLQLHDTNLLVAGDVPVKTLPLVIAGPLPSMFETLAPMFFKTGLVVAISSTEDTYTASASSFSLFGEFGEFARVQIPGAYTIAGDLHTTKNSQQIWADGTPHRLVALIVQEQLNTIDRYIRIETTDASSVLTASKFPPMKILAGQTLVLTFGTNGLIPEAVDSTSGYALHNGCTVRVADQLSGYPYLVTNNSAIIMGLYLQ